MSVEKLSDLDPSILESVPYSQVCNDIIEHIKDNDAFRVWCYSFSKSRNWKVLKEYTEKNCGVGKRKAEYIWSYLKRCGLVEYVRIVDEKTGHHIKTHIKILNGSKFNKDEPFLNKSRKNTTPANSAGLDGSTPAVSAAAVSAAAEMYPLRKKEVRKKEERKKEKSFYADEQKKSKSEWKEENAKQHAFAGSMNQMENERRHIEEHERRKRFETGTPMPDKIRAEIKRALGKSAYGWRSMYV